MRPVLVWLGVLAFVVGCASGAAAAEEGYVYTNADLLEMFGPPSPAPEPPAQPADGGWEMVIEFIDRQYERIDAERAHDLDRLLTEAEAGAAAREASEPRYYLPYSPYYVAPYRPRPAPRPEPPVARPLPSKPGYDTGSRHHGDTPARLGPRRPTAHRGT
ncbi:MAG: hypothetical protein GY716_23785 [bacterium]|nr:hypothetical protein [bacterium]